MRVFTVSAIGVATILVGSIAAQERGGKGGQRPGVPTPMKITIAGFPDGGTIPAKYANSPAGNTSPAIQWSGVPAGAVTIALLLHDADIASRPNEAAGAGPEDTLQWVVFNIPATASGLPEGVPHEVNLPDGSVQLKYTEGVPRRAIGQVGYFGPSPPPPAPHHYVFDFYALDTKLDPTLNSRADIWKAMSGHVLAKGVYFGTYTNPGQGR